jgi:hypothetical protein
MGCEQVDLIQLILDTIQCVVFKYSNESFDSIGHRKFLDLKSNNQLLTWVLCHRVNTVEYLYKVLFK